MKKLSKVILIFVVMIGILWMQSQVQASIVIDGNNTTTTTGNNTTTTTGNNTTTSTGNNITTNNTTANNTTTTNNTTTNRVNNITNTLPKTGIEDSPVAIIMIVGAISAIYAYKKIRDYNV